MVIFENLRNSDLIPGEIYEARSTGSFLAGEVISNIFKFDNLRGIGNQGGIRRAMIENKPSRQSDEAFVILLDTQADPQWENEYDNSTKILKYYGDNKNPDKHYLDTKQKGNAVFEKYFRRAYSNTLEHITPFFYFERVNGRDAKFIGIAVPYIKEKELNQALELYESKRDDIDNYENYVGLFTILEVTVPRQWLIDLKVGNESKYKPTAWNNFLQNRELSFESEENWITPNSDPSNQYDNIGYRMTAYRRTQSNFRKRLLERETCCQLCKLNISALLVASHILPWAIAEDYQKVDSNNGLLLCINHDAQFDKGLISFDENGEIIISDLLSTVVLEKLNTEKSMSIKLLPGQEQYMRIHRAAIKVK